MARTFTVQEVSPTEVIVWETKKMEKNLKKFLERIERSKAASSSP